MPADVDSAHADELFERLNSELVYIRPANMRRLCATTSAVISTLDAHDSAPPIRMLQLRSPRAAAPTDLLPAGL